MTHCETLQLCRSWELRVVGVGMGVSVYLSSSPSTHEDEAPGLPHPFCKSCDLSAILFPHPKNRENDFCSAFLEGKF